MLRHMLDTNLVVYVIKQRPLAILEVFNQYAGKMCISVVSEAELLHGAEKSLQREQNLRQVEDFTSRREVHEYGSKAAVHYGDICADLERKGASIRMNDLYVSAHARSEGLVLVTDNQRELDQIAGLRMES